MCYFIYLRLVPQRKSDEAKALEAAKVMAERRSLHLDTRPPTLTIANNGHCACDVVLKQKSFDAPVIDFVRGLAGQNVVKSVEIGYRWVDPMPLDAPVRRLSVEEFSSLSDARELSESVWYRVNDPSKYNFDSVHPAIPAKESFLS